MTPVDPTTVDRGARRAVGDYVLHATLGRGATSDVYAAEHRTSGARVALKLLRSELAHDADGAAVFAAEAAATRAVDHPNVVRVLDFGRDPATGSCYLVMEQIAGDSLAARLARDGVLAEAEVRALGAGIADGVAAAHARGVVHRDLKPANVMLAGAQPKLVDFGIARYLGRESAVVTGRRIGTPAYMAPEQLTGGLVAPCVDVWALGVILFELATGRLPFAGFVDGRLPQLFETAPRAGVSPALERVIASCLAREAGQRPRAAEVAAALRGEHGEERVTQDVPPAAIRFPAPPHAPPMRSREHAPRSRRGGLPLLVTVICLCAAVAVGIAARSPESAGSAVPLPSVPVPRPSVPVPSVPVPAGPSAFSISIHTTPPGANVLIDGVRRGVTPTTLSLAAPATLTLQRRGYRTRQIHAERAGAIEVVLARPRPAARPSRPSTRPTQSAQPVQPTTGEPLR